MKKTAIALTVAALAAASVAQAAPQANTFYAGAKAGWVSLHNDVNQYKGDGISVKRHDVTYGVFGGYQITDNVAVELGYDYLGRGKRSDNAVLEAKHKVMNHGAQLSLKASYPVLDNLDIYARAGAALVHTTYKYHKAAPAPQNEENFKTSTTRVSPLVAAGLEYAVMPELALRLEYQWINKVGKVNYPAAAQVPSMDARKEGKRVDFRPDVASLTLGVSYRFGQSAPVAPVQPEMAAEVAKTFTLKSDVLFAFNKATLKPAAQETLDGVYGEVVQLKSAAVQVAGYTDYLGSDAYNQKLSQQRADSVAAYLVGKGLAQETVSAMGHGEANPVKGQEGCKSAKGRKALIACLAEDRRVEISVKGTK